MNPRVWGLVPLLLVTVACSGGPAARPPDPVAFERGRALFRDKGCVTCHINRRAEGRTGAVNVGPDLTSYTGDPDRLRRWLTNPPAMKPGTDMPNLGLSEAEIGDLIAFLNAPR